MLNKLFFIQPILLWMYSSHIEHRFFGSLSFSPGPVIVEYFLLCRLQHAGFPERFLKLSGEKKALKMVRS